MIPENWQPYIPVVTSLVRHALGIAGGVGYTWAQAVTASQTEQIVSALMIAGSVVWSVYQKFAAQKALATAAANSAGATPPKLPA